MANSTNNNFDYSTITDVKDVDSYLWDLVYYVTTTKNITIGKSKKSLKDVFNTKGTQIEVEKLLAYELKENKIADIVSNITSSSNVKECIEALEKLFIETAKQLANSNTSVFQSFAGEQEFLDEVKKKINLVPKTSIDVLNDILIESKFYDNLKAHLCECGLTQEANNTVISIGIIINNTSEQDADNILTSLKSDSELNAIVGKIVNNTSLEDDEKECILYGICDIISNNNTIEKALADAMYTLQTFKLFKYYECCCINFMIKSCCEYQYASGIKGINNINTKILSYIKTKLSLTDRDEIVGAFIYYCAVLQELTLDEFTEKYKNELKTLEFDYLMAMLVTASA